MKAIQYILELQTAVKQEFLLGKIGCVVAGRGGGGESSSLNGHIKFSRPHSNFNGSRRWSNKVHKMDYVICFVLTVFLLACQRKLSYSLQFF